MIRDHVRTGLAAIALLLAAVLLLAALPAHAADADTAARIRRIEADLLPPVLVTNAARPPVPLAQRMAELHVPGVSIAIIHHGRIDWARGYGTLAPDGAGTGRPVTPDTLFQAGSISKPLAALTALRLVDAGQLALDTDIAPALKRWQIPATPELGAPTGKAGVNVTLRQLLTHTAGFTVHGFPGYASDAPVPTLVDLLAGTPPANTAPIRVDTAPGTKWRYSGGGYQVMQLLLEDTTRRGLAPLAAEQVLRPLGLSRSTFEQPLPENLRANAATPHRDADGPVRGGAHTYPEQAAAGLWTTPTDIARFALALVAADQGTGPNPILSQGLAQDALTPGLGKWGLGVEIGGEARPFFSHGGANEGFRNYFFAYRDGSGGLAIMTSSDSGGILVDELRRTVAAVYGWPDFAPVQRTAIALDAATLDRYAGTYRGADGAVRFITRDGDHLIHRRVGTPDNPLHAEGERDFFATNGPARVSFTLDADGTATGLVLRFTEGPQAGKDQPATRIEADAPEALRAQALDRRIRNNEQSPATEAALRRLITELAAGEPDYARLAPPFAGMVRSTLPQVRQQLGQLGALKSLRFLRVGPGGADRYVVEFAKGWLSFGIVAAEDGVIESVGFGAW